MTSFCLKLSNNLTNLRGWYIYKTMRNFLKKYRLTILGLIFGTAIALIPRLVFLRLPMTVYRLVDMICSGLGVFPFILSAIISDGIKLKRLAENWWKVTLPVTAFYWCFIGFGLDRLIISGKKQLAGKVSYVLIALAFFGVVIYLGFIRIEIAPAPQ